jgi:drug/metabolite transporter (DMT)-like permease
MSENVPQTQGDVSDKRRINTPGILNLLIVYVVWGSTYLAIRVAVRPGAGIPPFTLGFGRLVVAGTVLIGWSLLRKKKIRINRSEFLVLAASGLLLWTAGNGLVAWSEQRVDSSIAALLVATVPLWTTLFESILDRKLPSLMLAFSLVIGFFGIALISTPTLQTGTSADALSILALLISPACWAFGSILQNRRPVSLEPVTSSAYQQLFAAVGFAVLIFVTNEPSPDPSREALLAWAYLLIFGSIIAFTSYVKVLQLLPMSIAMTVAYVNPVIAVILGAMILGESITITTVAGAALVLVGVAGVFRARYGKANEEPVVVR